LAIKGGAIMLQDIMQELWEYAVSQEQEEGYTREEAEKRVRDFFEQEGGMDDESMGTAGE
jgi:hypothetical protein